tara:strand:+ start:2061 stop:2708 length:648 start_codon:yes stop_codon:yes gene_type:complete
MYLEFCNYNTSHFKKVEEEISTIFDSISLGFSGVAIPLHILKHVSTYLQDTEIDVATCVDFPYGLSDSKVRAHETLIALKNAADFIDIPLNPYFIKDRNYVKAEKEIKGLLRMCNDYGSSLRVIIHHNLNYLNESIAISMFLKECGVEYIIPASGFHNDDIFDNILTCSAISNKVDLKTVCNGYIWLEKQFNTAINSNISILRLYSLNLISTFSV